MPSQPHPPILTPGNNYLFRLNDGYEFEAKVESTEVEGTSTGKPTVVVVVRGFDRGWLNVSSIAVVWDHGAAD